MQARSHCTGEPLYSFFWGGKSVKTWCSSKHKGSSSGMVSMLCCLFPGFHLLKLLKLRMSLLSYPPLVPVLNPLPNEVCLQIFIRYQALLAQSVNYETTVPQNAIIVISALIIVKHCCLETEVK